MADPFETSRARVVLDRYWQSLSAHSGSGNRKAILEKIQSHPDWAVIRDGQGRAPWMKALVLNPGVAEEFTAKRGFSDELLQERDKAGRSLAFHLLVATSVGASRGFSEPTQAASMAWLGRHFNVPWLDTNGRGLLHQWFQDQQDVEMFAGSFVNWRSMQRPELPGSPFQWLAGRPEDADDLMARLEDAFAELLPPSTDKDAPSPKWNLIRDEAQPAVA